MGSPEHSPGVATLERRQQLERHHLSLMWQLLAGEAQSSAYTAIDITISDGKSRENQNMS